MRRESGSAAARPGIGKIIALLSVPFRCFFLVSHQERVRVMNLLLLSLQTGFALLVVLALAGKGPAQNKQTPPTKAGRAKVAEEAGLLKEACVLLLGANHDYDGHRGKAITAVKEALKLLGDQVKKNGTAPQKAALAKEEAAVTAAENAANKAKIVSEPQPKSDARLGQAKKLLAKVRIQLARNNQQNGLPPVDTAIKEVEAALKVSAAARAKLLQFPEAELLRKAYLLLLDADADYDGHRGKAMLAVMAAFNALDNQVMANGTDKQKAVIQKERAAIAEAQKARSTAGAIQENQLVSDALLTGTNEVLAELRPTLVRNKRDKLLELVDTAIKEIDAALKLR